MDIDLKPCPFCGGEAHIEQVGNRRHSTIYECASCGCRLETGEEFNHGARWNERKDSEVAELRAKMNHLADKWEKRAQSALPTDAMLINRHVRELREIL